MKKFLLLLGVVTVAVVGAGLSLGAKPAPPPPPPGMIYYSINDSGLGLWSMDGNGSGKTSQFSFPSDQDAYTSVPSLGSYNGHRWWLVVRPSGSTTDLFATKDGQSWIQLTASGVRDNGDGTETISNFAGGVSWSNDSLDQFCSIKVVRWVRDKTTGAYWNLQRVIYRLDVSAFTLETMVAGVDDPMLSDGDAGVTPIIWTSATLGGALGEHHWSPDGTKITFLNYFNNAEYGPDLWVADVSDLSAGPIDAALAVKVFENGNTFGAYGPQWSRHANPQDQRISFDAGGYVYTVSPNGSGLVKVTTGYQPFWSPDSKYLAYSRTTTKGTFGNNSYNVARIPATGGTIVTLTSDLDPALYKEVVGWSK